jgi:hypothetical protein
VATSTADTERAPRTRLDVVRELGRDLLLGLVGWTAGALVFRLVGSSKPAFDLGLFLGALFVTITVAWILTKVVASGRTPSQDQEHSIVWGAMAFLTGQALVGAAQPLWDHMTTQQLWTGVLVFVVVVALLSALLGFIRPDGWVGIGSNVDRRTALAIFAALLGVFAVTVGLAEPMMSSALVTHPCDSTWVGCQETPVPAAYRAIGPFAWSILIAAATMAMIAFAAELSIVAFGVMFLLYFAFAFWVQQTWRDLLDGQVAGIDLAALAVVHATGALTLLAATAVIQICKRDGISLAEARLYEWFRPRGTTDEQVVDASRQSDERAGT